MVNRQMTGLLIAAGCRQAFDWGHCPTAELFFRFTQRIRVPLEALPKNESHQ